MAYAAINQAPPEQTLDQLERDEEGFLLDARDWHPGLIDAFAHEGIMLEGILMTRLIFGENVHILSSINKVALPASLVGSVTRTRDLSSPRVQLRMVMLRSQSGRCMVMVITEYDDRPRQ